MDSREVTPAQVRAIADRISGALDLRSPDRAVTRAILDLYAKALEDAGGFERFDLVRDEMCPRDQGDWIRYDSVAAWLMSPRPAPEKSVPKDNVPPIAARPAHEVVIIASAPNGGAVMWTTHPAYLAEVTQHAAILGAFGDFTQAMKSLGPMG